MAARSVLLGLVLLAASPTAALEPIPEQLVVLTFDDAVKSHFSVVRPLLLRYGFGATFFVSEGFDFRRNKTDTMSWEEIAELHRDGFEIGNHTRDHLAITEENVDQLAEQLETIDRRCIEHGIPAPVSFSYPGNMTTPKALAVLRQHGIQFARRGGSPEHAYKEGYGFAYEPGLDHPLLIPSAGDARPSWRLEDFEQAAKQARHGRIAVLQFHGVPDRAHPWVSTPADRFATYMEYLHRHGYKVIALRDLARYVDADIEPLDPNGIIEDRKRMLAAGKSRDNFRTPDSDQELRFWLENMAVRHRYAIPEICAASGLSVEDVRTALDKFNLTTGASIPAQATDRLEVLPYPGGRHPRIGFLDGAIRPQRETKFSVFPPWPHGGYVVADVPEAIWVTQDDRRELLYLAHTHIPTMWTRQNIELDRLEWTRRKDGSLRIERRLPNAVTFGAIVVPGKDSVRMELWLTNGSDQTLSGLRVQNCVMLKAANGFASLSNDNKLLAKPYAACHNEAGDRWIITAWEPCLRPWANGPCPCMHSDPQFPDCEPGATQRVRGWLSFYEGTDIEAELRRIDALRVED